MTTKGTSAEATPTKSSAGNITGRTICAMSAVTPDKQEVENDEDGHRSVGES